MSKENGVAVDETKGPNKVEELHKAWVQNGSKAALPAVNKKLVGEYLAAKKAKEAAQAALRKAQASESAAVEAIILNNGKGRLRIGGEICIPMSRGGTVFFRGEGTGEVRDIG